MITSHRAGGFFVHVPAGKQPGATYYFPEFTNAADFCAACNFTWSLVATPS